MLHSKSVTSKVVEGVKYQEPTKYLFASDKDEKVAYMTLALFPKEGEVKLKLTNPNQKEGEMIKSKRGRFFFLALSYCFDLVFG